MFPGGGTQVADDTDQEIGKLRRFALAVGLVLFTVAIAGVELQSPALISPLGIPLNLKRPDLLGVGLCIASGYALIRYLLYGFVLTISPIEWRRRIRRGESLDIETHSPTLFAQEMTRIVGRYYPPLGKRRATFKAGTSGVQELSIPIHARVVAWLENLDYLAPALVNIVALLTYAGVFSKGYAVARYFIGH